MKNNNNKKKKGSGKTGAAYCDIKSRHTLDTNTDLRGCDLLYIATLDF